MDNSANEHGNVFGIELPKKWKVLDIIEPFHIPGVASVTEELYDAIENPYGCKAFSQIVSQHMKVVIIVDDVSRPTPTALLVPLIVDRLKHYGVLKTNVEIIFAVGTHKKLTKEEMVSKVSRGVYNSVKCVCHNPRDPENLVHLGKTSSHNEVYVNKKVAKADLRILVGNIEPHVFAGYGGGFKNVIPGTAGIDTISFNHCLFPEGDTVGFTGVDPDKSHMRRDIEQGCKLLPGQTFIINTVLNESFQIAKIFAGDAVVAHREGARFAQNIFGREIKEQADIVIADSFPMNRSLRQSFKCIPNTIKAAKPGGVIISIVEPESETDDISSFNKLGPLLRIFSSIIERIGIDNVIEFVRNMKIKGSNEEKFVLYFGLQAIKRNDIYMLSGKLRKKLGKKLPWIQIHNDNRDLIFNVQKKLANKPEPTVILFPYGGITFPLVED